MSAQVPGDPVTTAFDWLLQRGVTQDELRSLNPCVPGEFTTPGACYVNAATPGTIYGGTHEGTLPLVPGRWYLIPTTLIGRHPDLARDTVSVAQAVRLAR